MGNAQSAKNLMYGSHGIIGRRPTMEDSSVAILEYGREEQSLFGVFDGHNGPRCARYLARELPPIIASDERFETHPQVALIHAFLKADKEWLRLCNENGMKDGSTAIVAVVRGDQIYVANTGDSRAIIVHDGVSIPLSTDHKPTDTREKNRITAAGGTVFLGRVCGILGVARAFGDIDFKNRETCEAGFVTAEPDVKMFNITEQTEFLVLACDGVWDVLSNFAVAQFVRERLLQGLHPQVVCEELVFLGHKKGSTDNLSAIIVSFLTPERTGTILAAGKTKLRTIDDATKVERDQIMSLAKSLKSNTSKPLKAVPTKPTVAVVTKHDDPNPTPTTSTNTNTTNNNNYNNINPPVPTQPTPSYIHEERNGDEEFIRQYKANSPIFHFDEELVADEDLEDDYNGDVAGPHDLVTSVMARGTGERAKAEAVYKNSSSLQFNMNNTPIHNLNPDLLDNAAHYHQLGIKEAARRQEQRTRELAERKKTSVPASTLTSSAGATVNLKKSGTTTTTPKLSNSNQKPHKPQLQQQDNEEDDDLETQRLRSVVKILTTF